MIIQKFQNNVELQVIEMIKRNTAITDNSWVHDSIKQWRDLYCKRITCSDVVSHDGHGYDVNITGRTFKFVSALIVEDNCKGM